MSMEGRTSSGKWCAGRLPFVGAVVGVLALVALVVVPQLLAAHRLAGQSNAIAACKEIAEAQDRYHHTDWDGDGLYEYAQRYTLLYDQKDAKGRKSRLISEALALATRPGCSLHGFWFVDVTEHETGGPHADESGNQTGDHGVCAVPAPYPRVARLTYIIDRRGTVWAKDNGGKPVTVFPASPRKDGWRIAQ